MSEQPIDLLYVVPPSSETVDPPDAVRQSLDARSDVRWDVAALDDWWRGTDDSRDDDIVVIGLSTGADWSAARPLILDRDDPPPLLVYADTGALESAGAEVGAIETVAGVVQADGTRSGAVLSAELDRVVDRIEDSTAEPVGGDHFEAVTAVTSDAVVTIDESSTIRFVNQAITEQLGYEPEELIGEPLTKLMPQPLAREHRQGFSEYLESGERSLDWDHVELTGQHVDGYTVPLGISFCEFSQDGERYFTGILRDVSDRSDLEERRQHEQRVIEQVVETMPAGLVILTDAGDIQRMNSRAEDITGVSRETIQTSDDIFTFYDEDGERIPGDDLVFSSVNADGETVYDHVLQLERPDGERRWVSVNGARLSDADGDSVVRGIFTLEDVTDARTRAERLRSLTDQIQTLPEHETKDGLSDVLVRAVRETMPVESVAVALYEPTDGVLRTTAQYDAVTARTGIDADEPAGTEAEDGMPVDERAGARARAGNRVYRSGSEVWEAFIKSEAKRITWGQTQAVDGEPEDARTGNGSESEAVAAPMGQHGILLVRPLNDAAVGSGDDIRDYAEIIAATARSSFDRVDREADIREQRDLLQEKTGRLERVEQVNHAIRRITQVLLQAESQQEIEQLVCEELADVDPYALVWFGEVDSETGELVPTAVAGRGQGYLERVRVMVKEANGASNGGTNGATNEGSNDGSNGGTDDGLGPASAAIQSGEVSVQNSILDESEEGGAAWREAALERGFQSIATIPVQFRGTQYGALNLYAGQPGQFEHLEQAVLEEMSETIGFAMRSLERKHAFVSERSVELEVKVPQVDGDVFGFLPPDRGEIDVENMVLQMNGALHLFFRIRDGDVDEIRDAAFESDAVETFTQITDGADDADPLYECTIRGDSVVTRVLERGARFDDLSVGGGSLTARIRIPQRAEVREYVGLLEDSFGTVELLAKRELDESVMTAQEFEADVRNKLTARQDEVIETAYYSGYFEWPRESTGGEVADILGVTQPTVNRHIRSGERVLFGQLYDGDDADGSGDDADGARGNAGSADSDEASNQ